MNLWQRIKRWWTQPVVVYLAQKMTNRYCDEILAEARKARAALESEGLRVWSPSISENIPDKHVKLTSANKAELFEKWDVDKREGLRKCHVVYIASGDMSSRGVGQERGHSRWYLWRPVVRKHEGPHYFSITDIEEDGYVRSDKQAARYIAKKWNHRGKWVAWKLPHILFGIPKLAYIQVESLWI